MSTEQTFKILDGVYTGPEHWEGELDLRGYKETLVSLGNLKEVERHLYLNGCTSLTTLGKLKTVRGYLDIRGCTGLTTLGNIKTVGWSLDLEGCSSLKTLGNLETVGGWLDIRGCSNLTTLGNLKAVGGGIDLHEDKGVPLKEVQEKILHYSSLPSHEALNAITSKEVQEVLLYRNVLTDVLQKGIIQKAPLYKGILTEILQKGIIQKAPLYKRIRKYLPSWLYIKKEK